jgi:hypothetical protein
MICILELLIDTEQSQPIYYLRQFNILKNMSLLNNKLCLYLAQS